MRARAVTLAVVRQRALEALIRAGRPLSAGELSRVVPGSYATLERALRHLVAEGLAATSIEPRWCPQPHSIHHLKGFERRVTVYLYRPRQEPSDRGDRP